MQSPSLFWAVQSRGGEGLALEEPRPGEEDQCVHRTQHNMSLTKGKREKQDNQGMG